MNHNLYSIVVHNPYSIVMHITRWINVIETRIEIDRKIRAYMKENPRIPIIIALLQYYDQNYERPIYDYIKGIL